MEGEVPLPVDAEVKTSKEGLSGDEITRLIGSLRDPVKFNEESERLKEKYKKKEEPVSEVVSPVEEEVEIEVPVAAVPVVKPETTSKVDTEEDELNDKEKEWIAKIKSSMVHGKIPESVNLTPEIQGYSGVTEWETYGDRDLRKLAKDWDSIPSESEPYDKAAYVGKVVVEEESKGLFGNVTLKPVFEVVKIGFGLQADDLVEHDPRGKSTSSEGRLYLPAYVNLKLDLGQADKLMSDLLSGSVRANRLIAELYPGLKERILLRDKVLKIG